MEAGGIPARSSPLIALTGVPRTSTLSGHGDLEGLISTAWDNAGNWEWSDNARVLDWPGNNAARQDDVIAKGLNAPTLSRDLVGTLGGLEVDSPFAPVILGGNVTVGGGAGFNLKAGSINIGNGKKLKLIANTDDAYHSWQGGSVIGSGEFQVVGAKLYATMDAANLGCDLRIVGGGIVELDELNANLALSGESNNIIVVNGKLKLLTDLPAVNDLQRGGITGGSDHYIWVQPDGVLERGNAAGETGGTVLVSVPVTVEGGRLEVFVAKAPQRKNAIDIRGTDATTGYSLSVIDGGQVWLDDHTEVKANHSIYVNGATSKLYAWTNTTAETKLVGDVIFGDAGGELRIIDDVKNEFGTVTITGKLTMKGAAVLRMNWGTAGNDKLHVGGEAKLLGTIRMKGDGPPVDTWRTVVTSDTDLPNDAAFVNHEWMDSANSVQGRKLIRSYQVKWTLPPADEDEPTPDPIPDPIP